MLQNLGRTAIGQLYEGNEMLIQTFFKESSSSGHRAEIHENDGVFTVECYSSSGVNVRTGSSINDINTAKSYAENWLSTITVLNG
jgi:hypothetical protein